MMGFPIFKKPPKWFLCAQLLYIIIPFVYSSHSVLDKAIVIANYTILDCRTCAMVKSWHIWYYHV